MTAEPNATNRRVDEALERLGRWPGYDAAMARDDEALVRGELENLRADARVLAAQRDAAVAREEEAREASERSCLERNQQWWSEGQARGELAFVRRQLHDLAVEVARWPKPAPLVRFIIDPATTSKGREWWARLEGDGSETAEGSPTERLVHLAVVEEAEARVAARALAELACLRRVGCDVSTLVVTDDEVDAWARGEAERRARVLLARHGWREEFGAEVGRLLVLEYERGRLDASGCGDEPMPTPPTPSAESADAMSLTLGSLVAWLESRPSDERVRDLGYAHSYRGNYNQLAFEPVPEGVTITAGELLTRVRERCVGGTFGGWKGGDYTMHAGSAVYLSEVGVSSGVRLTIAYLRGESA